MPLKLTIKLDENGVPTLAKAKEAIASIESKGSGDYTAVGPKTKSGDRAYGRYQVMGANIPQWTKEVFGKPMTPKEFLANPQAQDAVFEAKFGGYMQKYGPSGAARAWFTGSPTGGGKDILGTSAEQYVNKFSSALGGEPTESAPASAPATPMTPGRFGLPAPSNLATPVGDVINMSDYTVNPDLLGAQISKSFQGLGTGFRFGGGKLNLRDQASINKDLMARGERPGSVQAVPPRQADIVPMQNYRKVGDLVATTTKPTVPPASAAFSSPEAQALNIANRVSKAVKENPELRKMLLAWVNSIDKFPDTATAVAKLDGVLTTAGY